MSASTLRQSVIVAHPEGFHFRPAKNFVECALRFQCEVYVCKEELRVNGKNILDLFMLVALQGSELVIEVCGEDAEQALPALVAAVNAPLDGSGASPAESSSPPAT